MTGAAAQGQTYSVSMAWDSAGHASGTGHTMLIGDQARVTFSVVTAPGTHIYLPSLNSYAQGDIMPLRQWCDSTFLANGRLLLRQITIVTCFEPGTHVIKGLCTERNDNRGNTFRAVAADSLTLHVNDMADVDTSSAKIKEIADIFHEPLTAWEFLRWPLLFLLLWAAWRHTAKRRRRKQAALTALPAEAAEPLLSPRRQALAELRELESRRIWQRGEFMEYYMQLTMIVRLYLKRRYHVDSTEMSSDETLEAFSGCEGFTVERNSLLRSVLRSADMVKFAKAVPTAKDHEQSMQNAVAFVEADVEADVEPGVGAAQPADAEKDAQDGNTAMTL